MRRKRKAVAEINVVPYIDVTLVLLIIFMITTPLLNLGVDVSLPESNANTVTIETEPVIINIDEQGKMYLSIGGEFESIDEQQLQIKLAAFIRANKDVPILIGADRKVDYGRAYEAMVVAQQAGADKVGLISDPVSMEK
ncbi:MAG TPA: ExbD/TolR family protein [Gammaproteobacteria bacterium]|nr:ExbD/TolR family protein [Xanthomonadales bacterium]MCB1593657.1 ExbD/TolR family protein [Xanthomonadales bacterium]HOP22820.1 ExbD/TolR family protein [Gammaproteobacteria bacterium]HPI95380.1 ExbD/TolR family protein [Gammaproteobacteria bacterium]HPQ87190.1 ExbD/TolR family protein [Gammaproteobacteria bacterium]